MPRKKRGSSAHGGPNMSEDAILQIEIEADSLDDLRAFVEENPLDLGCVPVARPVGRRFVAHAFVPETRLADARRSRSGSRVEVRVIADATEVGRQRQQEVGTGNRFANRSELPTGLGRKER